MPTTKHRLCSWHLTRTASTSHVRCNEFKTGFGRCVWQKTNIEQFDLDWQNLISTLSLGRNAWVQKVYKSSSRWTECHLREHFFGGIRATKHCEKLNA